MLKKLFTENFISILFTFITFRIFFNFVNINIYFEYLAYGTILLFPVLNNTIFSKRNAKIIIKIYFLLLGLQIIGLFQICTIFSLKNIISALVVFIFILILFNYKLKINLEFCMTLYYAIAFVLLIMTYDEVWLKNTIPAVFLFISCSIVIINLFYFKKTYNKIYILNILLPILLSTYISYLHHSRTALLTLFIIFISFLIVRKWGGKGINLYYLFYVLVGVILFMTYFYIHIKEFYFYNFFDVISYDLFGKFLDSSRPFLWSESLKILNDWQYLFGAGTGKLPEIERFKNGSFHNTYLQLFIQNGILGLFVLSILFRKLWNLIISTQIDDIVCASISIFIGIIIYNCYETTLLQNKTFLGLIEWLTLGIGYQYAVLYKNTYINGK